LENSKHIVNPEQMRLAMRNWATGVTIVSSTHDGTQHGMTVSSFTSISIDPPMVMVSLQVSARTHKLVKESGIFAVTILDASQKALSDRFAGRQTERLDRFRGLETFTLVTGAPLLMGGLVYFDCQVCESIEISRHTLFVGSVLAMQAGTGNQPLIYFDRNYYTITEG
jgi:flavin reductase (DIM6/NTAB) family NADH-FMN oxidoreductase RutF